MHKAMKYVPQWVEYKYLSIDYLWSKEISKAIRYNRAQSETIHYNLQLHQWDAACSEAAHICYE